MNSTVLDYLNTHYPLSNRDTTPGWSDKDIIEHFFVEFGVNVVVEGIFYLFKYEVCVVGTWKPQVLECRGLIISRYMNEWRIKCRPFDKFFNRDEPGCPYYERNQFDALCSQFSLSEKADGTCIQLWHTTEEEVQFSLQEFKRQVDLLNSVDLWDDLEETENEGERTEEEKRAHSFYRKIVRTKKRKDYSEYYNFIRVPEMRSGWRISTLGKTTPDIKFDHLFWQFFNEDVNYDLFDPEYSYLFELCSSENRVVTVYPEDSLFLFGARHLENGQRMDLDVLDNIAEEIPTLKRPVFFTFENLGITNLEELESFVDAEAKKTNYGENPEGFVVYLDGVPVAKMKNKYYHNVHQILTGSTLYLRNRAISAYFEEELDDIQHLFPPYIHEYLGELKEKVKSLMDTTSQFTLELRREILEDIEAHPDANKWKLYSQHVNSSNEKALKGFLFRYKVEILESPEMIRKYFWEHLKEKYPMYHHVWTDTQNEEIQKAEKIQEKAV
eukprot:TRINITY_DN3085_c0_g1_i1.p1 TRINITY_DN3085_c0_g1~~TRINITY_DN3085_c0_g1_i1.p1  ORF type:complete len:498 (+),score=116.20 TRINITY_DN3085_c0_g1_i1:69-1562(+)